MLKSHKSLFFAFGFMVFFGLESIAQGDLNPFAENQDHAIPNKSVTEPATTALWLGLYSTFKINDNLFYYAETHYRRKNSLDNRLDFAGRMSRIYNRHGLKYIVNDQFNITAGPVIVLRFNPFPEDENFRSLDFEARFWHQYIFVMAPMGRLRLYHQLRFEHRFRRTNEIGDDFMYTDRYRYKMYAYIPINKPQLQNNTFFISPSFEIFLESGKDIAFNPMENFRIYTGLGYIFNSRYMIFGGHMWTLGQSPQGNIFNQRHILRLNLYINFDISPAVQREPLPFRLN